MSYLRLEGISHTFKTATVLHELHLHVEQGELLTLLGASGCGKSTLLRCISGLLPMERGEIYLDQRRITSLMPKQREVGMVFQSYALFPNMTVYDNIAFGLIMKRKSKADIQRRVEEMVRIVGLEDKMRSYPYELSGGQQQRVALARSLAVEPKLMLMDEPFSALDAQIRKQVRSEFRRIQRELGMTTIFVTHDQEEALTLSDRVCIMSKGRIVQIGSPEQVYTHPQNEFVARFIGHYNILTPAQLHSWQGGEAKRGSQSLAIRPEAIRISPAAAEETTSRLDADLHTAGRIEELAVLGNIIRYTVQVNGTPVTVDTLNGSQRTWLKTGTAVHLGMQWADCQPLESGEA
ncbi:MULTISPECIES: ABC transporter ATP-binding protein [Paenibacillus]|uniref:ABC transporter ATP-binding protein n=1 Tax=Paenibacillus TaxID=44249 RepID=UPI0022B8CBDC|nr:ABC transporter ATP-binding protein [Paenibacillus caseinilyticus]MCZ8521328.1 ABC transporter ATP-binding protein [Paenibacillus caseinilyticus]